MHRYDVRVRDRRRRLGLALEPAPRPRVLRQLRCQDFDGDQALERGVAGQIHAAHTATAQLADQEEVGGEGIPQ